jgi:peptidyl-prolyl cis-trans isomerase SurA
MLSLKKLTKEIFIFFLVFLYVFPFVVHAKVFDKVVAKVNAEIITLSSVQERSELLQNKYAQSPMTISQQELLKEALEMIIEERLQLQEGKKMGFIVDEDSIDAAMNNISQNNGLTEGQLQSMLEREGRTLSSYRDHIRDQILVSKIARFEIGNRVKVSDKDINHYYKSHQNEFWEDGRVRVRHILFIVEPGSSEKNRKTKLEQAKKILNKIEQGGDFIKLAMRHSEDVSASNGGDVGFVTKGKMVPEFEEAVFKLKTGQTSDIVETEYGYHIIRVDEIQDGKTLALKDAKDSIANILSKKKEKEGYDDWIRELKKAAFIEVSLFSDSEQNNRILSGSSEEKTPYGDLKIKKKLTSRVNSRQQILQKKWEEMYKSVEKSKEKSKEKNSSQLESLKEQLRHIKKLRDENSISKDEYRNRKEKLLNYL